MDGRSRPKAVIGPRLLDFREADAQMTCKVAHEPWTETHWDRSLTSIRKTARCI